MRSSKRRLHAHVMGFGTWLLASQQVSHLKDGGWEHGSIGGEQLSTADDNQGQAEGQAKSAVQRLLCSRIVLLDLRRQQCVRKGACIAWRDLVVKN